MRSSHTLVLAIENSWGDTVGFDCVCSVGCSGELPLGNVRTLASMAVADDGFHNCLLTIDS